MKAIGTGARFDFRELEVLREGNAWRLALKDEAKRWAGAFASKRPQVSVERRPEWVEAIVRFKDVEEVTQVWALVPNPLANCEFNRCNPRP